jgi:hypothetical protein
MQLLRDWATRHAPSVLLGAAGVVLVALAVLVVPDRQAVASTLVVFGASAFILGALLPRVEGALSIGPEGLKVILTAVDRRAGAMGLSQRDRARATERAIAYGRAVGRVHLWSRAVGHRVDAVISPPVADAIADAAIADVLAEDSGEGDVAE